MLDLSQVLTLSIFAIIGTSAVVPLPVNTILIYISSAMIVVGARLALQDRMRSQGGDADSDEDTNASSGGKKGGDDSMTTKDALWFPVVGSVFLVSIYVVFKVVPKEYIDLAVSGYFGIVGLVALTPTIGFMLRPFLTSKKKLINFRKTFPLLGEVALELDLAGVVGAVISCAVVAWYIPTRHWLANNMLGVAFSIQGIRSLAIGRYATGAMLLTGLFFYDIFWVFGTDVMVTVAQKFDAPIKILFLRSFETHDEDAKFSLLGLGDIVLPGVFLAFLMRLDAFRAGIIADGKGNFFAGDGAETSPTPITNAPNAAFSKPFFNFTLIMYAAGLFLTVFMMVEFESAQPALLYLVPAVILASLLIAVFTGSLSTLLGFNEATEEEKEEKKTEEVENESVSEVVEDASDSVRKRK